ncbi:hypothetical protein Ancab_017458 [Ancistrocladus abbreviatus]
MLNGGQMQKFGQKVSSHREFSQLPHSFTNAVKDNNTEGCKCLEFARILLHTSSMGMINSLVRIQVDSAIVSARVVEEGTLFDGHEILRRCNKGYPSVLVSRIYIEESLIGKSLMGYRLSEVKAVDDCQTDYQIGFRGWLVDLSGTLQRGYGEPDDGAGKGFSRWIFELGDGCINGCNNYNNEGENCSPVIIPNSGSVKKGIGGTVGLPSVAHLMKSRGLKMNPKEAQMLQAESGKKENSSGGDPLDNLRKRFHPEMSEREAANFMIPVCADAYNKWTTAGYDLIQYLQQGIEK